MLRFFYWPAVGPDITEERRKPVEDKEIPPLAWARVSIMTVEEDLKTIMANAHETYRTLTMHTVDIQGYLQNIKQALRDIENERPK